MTLVCTKCGSPAVTRMPNTLQVAGMVGNPPSMVFPDHCSNASCKYSNGRQLPVGWCREVHDGPK